jgi:hypothetical protein
MISEDQGREFVEKWKRVGPLLQIERERKIRETDTPRSIPLYNDVLAHALRTRPPRLTSGLIQWRELMRRAESEG